MAERAIPVLRVAHADVALPWYRLLGFEEQWRHQFDPGFPVFVSVQRGDVELYLSEHEGDAVPGDPCVADGRSRTSPTRGMVAAASACNLLGVAAHPGDVNPATGGRRRTRP